MSAPRLINPPPTSGGVPVGGSGTVGTLPIWVGASTLGDSAVTQVSGSIFTLTGLVAGTGYTQGSAPVALGGGTGTGATAGLVISSGSVQWVQLLDPGSGYTAGDVLTIPGGVGGTITVLAVVPKNSASGHFTAQRIGAGTTQPDAGIDSRFGAVFTGWQRRPQLLVNGLISTSDATMVRIGGNDLEDIDVSNATTLVGLGIFPRVTSTTARAVQAIRAEPQVIVSSGATSRFSVIYSSQLVRASATDLNTATFLRGAQINIGNSNQSVVYTTPEISGVLALLAHTQAAGSVNAESKAYEARNFQSAASAGTVTLQTFYNGQFRNDGGVVYSTHYGVRLPNAVLSGAGTRPASYWGVSQEDTLAKNQFLGNVGVGVDAGAGKAISALALTAGGTLYTTGTYSQVALTGGTGTGATADVTISGGAVTNVFLRAPGQGYVTGDVLSVAAASVGGTGSGFQTTATVASIARADGQVVAPRIGAGTTAPRAGVDVASGGELITSSAAIAQANNVGGTPFIYRAGSQVLGALTQNAVDVGVAAFNARVWSDVTAAASPQPIAFNGAIRMNASGAAQTPTVYGAAFSATRGDAADLSTAPQIFGVSGTGAIVSGVGAATTSTLHGVIGALAHGVAGHVVTNGYAIRATIQADGNFTNCYAFRIGAVAGTGTITNYFGLFIGASTAPTITNRYGIVQEDTLGGNYLRAKTFFGPATGTAATTNASVEVTAQGTLNGDVRINSASAVFDASASSTNGTKYFNRGGVGISTTTQSYYEEGSYTPTTVNYTLGNFTATWTRIGRKVFVTINSAAGTNNGSTIAGASSIGLPAGLAPVRSGLGLRGQPTGAASGNGLVAASAATGLIEISTTVTLDTNAKVIQVEYEV